MSLPSWKSYGGINAKDKTNNIVVNSLSANYFTLKNAYVGYFSISGDLLVTQTTTLQSNVLIGGNSVTKYDTTTGGNNYIKGSSNIVGNVYVGNELEVSGNTLLKGNLHVLQNYEIEKNLKINGNIIQLGLLDRINQLYNVNLYANGNRLGYNKIDPEFTFDVVSSQENGFQIKSTTLSNTNTISQNSQGQKISVTSGVIDSSLSFSDSITTPIIPNASIKYIYDGNIIIDVKNNTTITSKLTVNNNNSKLPHSINNESVLIYDVSNGAFFSDIYNGTIGNIVSTGNALTLVSDNNLSNTGMNIITPLNKGMKLLGGIDSYDNTRSVSILGVYDSMNNMIPTQTIISGNIISKIRSTMGINTLFPETENYVLDVNGPIKVSHSEIIVIKNVDYYISKMIFYDENKTIGIAFGNSTEIINSITLKKTYQQRILYTINSGKNWNETIFYEGDDSIIAIKLVCGFICSSTVAIIGGTSGILLVSVDGFKTWYRVKGMSLTTTITSVLVLRNFPLVSSEIKVCLTYLKDSIKTIGFFILTGIGAFATEIVLSRVISSRSDVSIFYENKPPLTILLSNIRQINAMKELKYGSAIVLARIILLVGEGGIGRCMVDSSFTFTTLTTSSTMLLTSITSYNGAYTYNDVDTYLNLCIAVGKGIISSSIDDGLNWKNIIFDSSISFNSVYIYNGTNAIVVGDGGKILVTIDSGTSWTSIDSYLTKTKIISSVRNIQCVTMVDNNTFLLSLQPILLSTSILISCYFPDLFNHINNTIMDIYGNMKLSGDISVYDNAYISKNLTVTNDSIVKGNSTIGLNLSVQLNATIQGNTLISGNTFISGNTLVLGNIVTNQGLFTSYLDSIDNVSNNKILIGTKYKGGTTIQLSNDSMTNTNNILIGGIKDNVTIKGNVINFLSNVSLTSINDINNEILIGTKNGGGKTIRISGGTDGTGSSASNPNNIYIGGIDDNVIIKGNNVQILGTIATAQSQIQLNNGYIGTNGSAGSGINIRDNNNNSSGFIRLNSKLDGYLFKSSDTYPNILNIRVNDLTIKNKVDSNLQPILNGLVILKSSSVAYGEIWDSNICTMTTASFDVNNIILGNSLFKDISLNQQTISTDFGIQGNTIFYNKTNSYDISSGSLQIRGGISIIGNTYIGGNLITYKDNIFNGNVKINSLFINDGDTILNGNVTLKNPTTLTGNVVITGSYNKFNGKNEFLGNVSITNNIESYGISSGSIIITGGTGISGNIFIGKDLNVIGNTFLPTLNITNITEATSTSGPLLIKGGVCIQKSLFVNGNVNININSSFLLNNTTNATTMENGSFILYGGGSIQKSLLIGDNETIGMNNIIQILPLDILFTSLNQTITTSSINYKNGLYNITSSSSSNLDTYYDIFNENSINNYNWTAINNSNDNKTMIGTNLFITGQYLQVTIPYEIILTSYKLQGVLDKVIPTSWYICGSNDGITFNVLDSRNITSISKTNVTLFTITKTNTNMISYKKFRIIVTETADNTNTFSVGKFILNGFPINLGNTSLLSIGNSLFLGNITNSGINESLNTTDSTSITTGSFVLKGGVGIQGNSYFNATNIMGNLFINKNVQIGNSTSTSSSSSSSSSIYALDVNGSMNVSGQFSLGNIILTDNTDSIRLGTGSLIVNGGSSIKGNAYFGGNIFFGGNVTMGNCITTGTFSSNIFNGNTIIVGSSGSILCNGDFICRGKFINDTFAISSTTESFNPYTGAFLVPGGIGIGGNINIAKNIYATNINASGSQNINLSLTIGSNLEVYGNSIINGNEIIYGNVFLKNTTDATILNTGSLQIKGGASIVGNIVTGGNMMLQKQLYLLSKVDSTSLGTGSLIISGGGSVSGNCHIGGNTIIYGSYGGNTTLGITFPITISSPTSSLFVKTVTNSNIINITAGINDTVNSSTIISQSGISSYQNGTYYFSTGVKQHNIYQGYNALINSSIPWISSYNYNNTDGYPSNSNSLVTTTYNTNIAIVGDYLQYGLPYQMILSNYSLTFKPPNGVTTIVETTPSSWYLFGSIDNITWYLIHSVSDYTTSNDISINVTETRPFSSFRFVISKVLKSILLTTGVQVPGIYNITYSGLPYLLPIPTTVTTTTTTTTTTGPIINTNQEIILPTSINTNSFIGTNTFAGASTLINFGDSTTYGNYNLFRNLNIFGNITTARDDYNLSINSNILLYGNIDIKQNSFIRGQSTLYGTTTLKEMVSMEKDLSITGNVTIGKTMTVSGSSVFNSTLTVAGSSVFNSTLTVAGSSTLNSTLTVAGSSTLNSTLTVAGSSNLNNTLTVAGSSNLNNTLTVAGSSNLNSTLTVGGSSNLNSTLTVGGSSNLNSTLTVSGSSNLNSTLTVSGSSTLNSTLTVGDSSVFSGNMSVTGSTIFQGSILCNSLSAIISNATNLNISLSDKSLITKSYADNLISTEVTNRNSAITTNLLNYLPLIGGRLSGNFIVDGTTTIAGQVVLNNTTDVVKNVSAAFILQGGAMFKQSVNVIKSVFVGLNSSNEFNIILDEGGIINAVSYNAKSDYRIKENIVSLNDNFTVDSLRPVHYTNKVTGKEDIGLVAHELQEIYPFLVYGEKDGKEIQSVNYLGLIGILINEIQILKSKVDLLMMDHRV